MRIDLEDRTGIRRHIVRFDSDSSATARRYFKKTEQLVGITFFVQSVVRPINGATAATLFSFLHTHESKYTYIINIYGFESNTQYMDELMLLTPRL